MTESRDVCEEPPYVIILYSQMSEDVEDAKSLLGFKKRGRTNLQKTYLLSITEKT